MKYCLYRDMPLPMLAGGKQDLSGCDIVNVHHACESCPNLTEMSDCAYNVSNIDE